MLIDSHAHIYSVQFDPDFDAMLDRAAAAGVEAIVMPAIDLPSIERAVELSERHPRLHAMAALHPSEVRDATDADFEEVVRWCRHPRVVAVGESGLDYYWDRSFDARQRDFLRRHIQLAYEADLPLILHNRDASDDLVRTLREERAKLPDPARLRGIFHCFGGPESLAREAAEMGFLIGIGGTITFKNSGVAEAVRDFPLEYLVVETDSPYLAPVPHRGKRNEPAYVSLVAQRLAEVKRVSLEEVAAITTANAKRVFGILED
jgi:TatD DNase family protein